VANHGRAVTLSRDLSAANPGDVELRVALALALAGRGDAYAAFARDTPASPTRRSDLAAAERDYAEAVKLLTSLDQEGAIEGTDRETLENARKELARIREESRK
jgi:hypothetical protein